MRRWRPGLERAASLALASSLALLPVAAGALAQSEAEDPAARVARLALLELPGDLVPVRYAAGALHRASQLQAPFELLVRDFGRWSDRDVRLSLLLLGPDEWAAAEPGMPYGTAARLLGSSVALAAWGDEHSVRLWRRLLGGSPPPLADAPMRSSAEEAASLVPADLLGLFEGARLLVERAGYRGSEPWLTEVAAHTVAASVIARSAPGGLADATEVYRRLGGAVAPLPLAAYRSGLALEEWLWFQAAFFDAARGILEHERRGAAKSVVKLARRGGGRLERAELLERYPFLGGWLERTFAPPGL